MAKKNKNDFYLYEKDFNCTLRDDDECSTDECSEWIWY